ncbi:hypothetical protein PV10_00330 [Exophiala mesophila]|uniref:Uncharacterized protein n=1 Tax=Exophiala mesophila TaxID=212818 RepID=A0A0D1X3R5_EXOME|nr:uncharacterized protein PV10_00330 [Exophiala mesophila]KIV96460.1 hypothetical protein PV10_00330 [Exophiala mesophila]
MGFTSRRPLLPAPTDSLLGSADEAGLETDLDQATDLSQRPEKTWEEIPTDGTPITITTASKHRQLGKLSKPGQQSQTSLLIELFEGSKVSDSGRRRPSLRVRYTPSHSRKDKGKEKDQSHILVTESKSPRRPSQTHRIVLGGNETLKEHVVDESISSLDSAGLIRPRAPIEIDVQQGEPSDLSSLSASPEPRFIIPGSDISSMPPESNLGLPPPIIMAPSDQSATLARSTVDTAALKPPIMPSDRNVSNERITQKVIEKLSNKPRVHTSTTSKRHRGSHSSSYTSGGQDVETGGPSELRSRTVKKIDDDSIPSATGSSLLSGSHLSAGARAQEQRSVRSGTSNVSLTNNPKLIQTVEDIVRRLILPELKDLKRDQTHHRSRHDKLADYSDLSSTTVSKEERPHRRSSGSKTKRRVSREVDGGKHATSRRHRHHEYDSPSEQSYDPSESLDSGSYRDEKKHRKSSRSHRTRDIAAGAIGGAALTAAALKSHDSGSSVDQSERRRRRRSKSRSSRSTSYAEKDDAFSKHKVPAMPFVSEVGTDLTRSSLQSSLDGGAATPTRREVREVVRGSPLALSSPRTHTPTKHTVDLRRGLGTHHGNFSEHDLSGHDLSTRNQLADDVVSVESREAEDPDFATHGFAALTDPELARAYERNLHQQHPIRRGLSPIQSVASYATTEPNRNSTMRARSTESLGSVRQRDVAADQESISSFASTPIAGEARSMRPHGISLENRSEIMGQHGDAFDSSPQQQQDDAIFDEQHLENESYRHSPYVDKVTAGRQVARALGATAEYIDNQSDVESAVASLIEPSAVDQSNLDSPRVSHASSPGRRALDSPHLSYRGGVDSQPGSPLKQQLSHGDHAANLFVPVAGIIAQQALARPSSRVSQTSNQRSARSSGSQGPVVHDPTNAELSPNSEITTNPSVIQGPISGVPPDDTSHWPYDPTPPRSRADLALPPVSRDIGSAGTDLVPEALSFKHNHDLDPKRDLHVRALPITASPGAKDEGYETGANAPSPGLYQPAAALHDDRFTPDIPLQDPMLGDDPFTITPRDQYISGTSRGLSPGFDSAIDRNRDRIQSRDIVRLMDHLTIRDAQRNARDTEILVTLVRSAAEMRNSFEDVKKFIAEQDELLMDNAASQHDKLQRLVGGPRPQPGFAGPPARSANSEDDLPAKRRNVFQRALRGLGNKNTQELQNIEAMLLRLLHEMEGLRGAQSGSMPTVGARQTSLMSADNTRAPTDTGYEPDGQAGTSSTGDRSGFFSNNSSRQADYRNYNHHRESGNRVSTVMEDNEEYDEYDDHLGAPVAGNIQVNQPPHGTPPRTDPHVRGASVPLQTPPRTIDQAAGSLSQDNTPHLSQGEGSGKKHKSFAPPFFSKMVSRWSKTTASSAENFRASQQRHRPYSEMSRSGSNLGEYDYDHDPEGDDRLRSNTSFNHDQYGDDDHRPPSPLIPSHVSDNPKYQAHRNSVNLQHPQPRQGPTGRYQSRLESEAQYYHDQLSPASQTSSQWENGPGMHSSGHGMTGYDGPMGSTSDAPYSAEPMHHHDNQSIRSGASQGPPRPPKILDGEPLVPQRPPKVLMSPQPSGSANRQPTYVDHVTAARAGSPAFDKSPVAALRSPQSQGRKPSGPRPLVGARADPSAVKRTRFRGSPNQIDSDDETTAAY